MKRWSCMLLLAASSLAVAGRAAAAELTGRITAGPAIEQAAPLSAAVDAWVCAGEKGTVPDPRLLMGPRRGLANVVVTVLQLGDKAAPYPGGDKPLLDQEKCVFKPHVVVVAPGQDLLVHNSDPLLHNVRITGTANRGVNRAQPRGAVDTIRFAVPEILRVQCDVHYWMSAIIVVAPHALVAVTRPDGTFQIDGLTPGRYELALWHEKLGRQQTSVLIGDKGGRLDWVWNVEPRVRP